MSKPKASPATTARKKTNNYDKPDPEQAIKTLSLRQAIFLTLTFAGVPQTENYMRRQLTSLAKARAALEQLDPNERGNPAYHHMHKYL